MPKNLWPILVLAGLAYAYYTGWHPLAGRIPAPSQAQGRQAGGPAAVRAIQEVPQAIQEMPDVSTSAASTARAARDVVQRTVGGGR
jgi:hypothetical protein